MTGTHFAGLKPSGGLYLESPPGDARYNEHDGGVDPPQTEQSLYALFLGNLPDAVDQTSVGLLAESVAH